MDTKSLATVKISMLGDGLHHVYLADKKFIMDNRSFAPASYFWGVPTATAIAEMVEIKPKDKRFTLNKPSYETTSLIIMSQVVVKALSSMIKQSDLVGRTEAILGTKLFVWLLTLGLSYLVYIFLLSRRNKRVAEKWPTIGARYRVTFRTVGQPQIELLHLYYCLTGR